MFKNFILALSVILASAAGQFVTAAQAEETKAKPGHAAATKQKAQAANDKSKKGHRTAKRPPVSIALGKRLYRQYQCYDCHNIAGKGCDDGMKLDAIGSKRSKEFIREHIADPDKHFDKHPQAFETDLNLMPPQNLEPYEIDSLVEYLHSLK